MYYVSIINIIFNKENSTLQNHLKYLDTHKEKHLLARFFILCFLANQIISKKKKKIMRVSNHTYKPFSSCKSLNHTDVDLHLQNGC